MESSSYQVYKLYARAKSVHTDSWMKAGSLKTFNSRQDKFIFDKLIQMFQREGIKTKAQVESFMRANAMRLKEEFYPRNLLNNEAIDHFRKSNKIYGSVEQYLDHIFNSFRYINEFCEENAISVDDYFKRGRPSNAIKHLKSREIPEDIVVHSPFIDLGKLRRDRLMGIYLKDFFKKIDIIKERIKDSRRLQIILNRGFEYLRKQDERRKAQ